MFSVCGQRDIRMLENGVCGRTPPAHRMESGLVDIAYSTRPCAATDCRTWANWAAVAVTSPIVGTLQ